MLKRDLDEIAEHSGDALEGLRGSRVLVTGAFGFLGRYLTSSLARVAAEVTAVDRAEYRGLRFAENVRVVPRFDVAKRFINEGRAFDHVVHCAGIASPYHYQADPLGTIDAATLGLRNMLDLAERSGSSLLSFSSSEVYGNPDSANVPTREGYNGDVSSLGPRACYDISKRMGETLCSVYHRKHGVRAVIVRPFNVYGPGMPKGDSRVLPSFATSAARGEPLTVYDDGRQTRTFCYVTDAVAGFLRALALGTGGEAYNVGNPEPELSMLGLAERVRGIVPGVQVRTVEYPSTYPADEPRRRCPDITKARQQLGYEPRVSLEDGLGRFFDWALPEYRS